MTAPAPAVCGRCSGDGVLITERDGRLYTQRCPDCRCGGCGRPAITICDDCLAVDQVRADVEHGRAEQ